MKTTRGVPDQGRRGHFTLIELLVVISIIAVLASMLLPALQSAKRRSETAVCSNTLRQCMLASLLYAGDYDNYFFLYDANTGAQWHAKLYSCGYMREVYEALLFCPSRTPNTVPDAKVRAVALGWAGHWAHMTYGQNRTYYTDSFVRRNLPAAVEFYSINRIPNPPKFHLLGDTYASGNWNSQFYAYFDNSPLDGFQIHRRHFDRANLIFADGHAEACGRSELKAYGNRCSWNQFYAKEQY